MRKFSALIMVLCMMFTMAACDGGERAAEAETYKLGMGVDLKISGSRIEQAQVDAAFAAVVTDAEGKIVLCRIDCVQSQMRDAGDEWDVQTKAFEESVVGKTADEVEALVDECTIDIVDFKAAVVKACNDEKGMAFETAEAFSLGLAAVIDASESTADADGNNTVVKMYSEYGAAVVAADGKILAALNDAAQPKIYVNAAGEIVESYYKATKRELGSDYGMVAYGAAIAEWDVQSSAFSKYVVGKTADEVRAIKTTSNDYGYAVSVDETLYAECTMQITGMIKVIARAAEYAR